MAKRCKCDTCRSRIKRGLSEQYVCARGLKLGVEIVRCCEYRPIPKPKKYLYVLLADVDGTMRSGNDPFGVAVTTEEEAKRFAKDGGVGYFHSYCKVAVFDNKDDALKFAYPEYKE